MIRLQQLAGNGFGALEAILFKVQTNMLITAYTPTDSDVHFLRAVLHARIR